MEVNVVKVPEDADFMRLRQLCDEHTGWTVRYHKKSTTVWTKPSKQTDFHMIKARCEYADVPASTVYDVLHDPDYRPEWDKYLLDARDIGLLNPNNDICYYALRSLPPVKHRDFVIQRSWLDLDKEKFIFNHSVCHDDFPPRRGIVRAVSYMAGYLVRWMGIGSCQVSYLTHCDPKGRLPGWLLNKITHTISPKMMKRLHKACLDYPAWKACHNPIWKPWSYPEQQTDMVRVNVAKCVPRLYATDDVDESQLSDTNTNGSLAGED